MGSWKSGGRRHLRRNKVTSNRVKVFRTRAAPFVTHPTLSGLQFQPPKGEKEEVDKFKKLISQNCYCLQMRRFSFNLFFLLGNTRSDYQPETVICLLLRHSPPRSLKVETKSLCVTFSTDSNNSRYKLAFGGIRGSGGGRGRSSSSLLSGSTVTRLLRSKCLEVN